MPAPTRPLLSSWSATLQLPKSSFPARVSPANQAIYLARCTDDLYAWQRRERPEDNPFTLHDGPPYANGSLHVGHALNKILKDIICRFQLGQGKRVHYVPGWDCHGLPIEQKALQLQKGLEGGVAGSKRLGAVAVRKAARELAAKTVEEQKSGFRQWAIMGDWENAYQTMDKTFETRQLGIFKEMVENGLIYRRFKPVYWSPSSGSALAEAELEYKDDHISTAAFVKFPITKLSLGLASHPGVDMERLGAVIWTTTPWTLPANRAIAVHSDLEYSIVEAPEYGQLLLAKSRVPYVFDVCFGGVEPQVVVDTVTGADIAGTTEYINIIRGACSPSQKILHADFVSADSGSGLVHCAPGHGMEDYEMCTKQGIAAFAPVDDEGRFTKEAMPDSPETLRGKEVQKEGNKEVIKYIDSVRLLLAKHNYKHKYPYDWRSKQPVIVRATEQWFADVQGIKSPALEALAKVRFIPETGKARLESFVKGRSEWCISRQRAWGVPIPALYHTETGAAVLTNASVGHIMKVIDERGIDAWWTDADEDSAWTPPELLEASGKSIYRRGRDTMDVWFDSGTSWTQLQAKGPGEALADVYLEGTDQHRGWFQSSLLTHVAHQSGQSTPSGSSAPYKNLITHGFTLDQAGKKMSKSLGNVISPDEIMSGTLLPPMKKKKIKGQPKTDKPMYDGLGPDALRLWVASSDYTRDVVIGQPVLKAVSTSMHKFRVTMKLLLGALEDWDPKLAVAYKDLTKIDQMALLQLSHVINAVLDAYQNYEFYKGMFHFTIENAINALTKYINIDLSAFYIETLKDRLYADSPHSLSRLAAQTVLAHIYEHLQAMLAPVTPLLVEEAWAYTPAALQTASQTPLQRIYPRAPTEWQNPELENDLPWLSAANTAVKAAQEQARADKKLGSSLGSDVVVVLPEGSAASAARSLFERYLPDLESLFVVSNVRLAGPEALSELAAIPTSPTVPAEHAEHAWSYTASFALPPSSPSTPSTTNEIVNNTETDTKGTILVLPPSGAKCPRCWRYASDGDLADLDPDKALCDRCVAVIRERNLREMHEYIHAPRGCSGGCGNCGSGGCGSGSGSGSGKEEGAGCGSGCGGHDHHDHGHGHSHSHAAKAA
ncbi:MAG: hypothetical protein M1819_003411 [Sarea resinae]|nr:MAG: hypothetical protein M1819_003411 [Sarea resinae]